MSSMSIEGLGLLHHESALLYGDSKVVLHIAANPVLEQIRYIEMDCHFIRDKIQDGSVTISYVTFAHQ